MCNIEKSPLINTVLRISQENHRISISHPVWLLVEFLPEFTETIKYILARRTEKMFQAGADYRKLHKSLLHLQKTD